MIRLFAGLVLLAGLVAVSAVEPIVTIDGAEAHATRVLAKFKPAADVGQATAAANMKVSRRFSTIPGLAVIDLKEQPGVKAALAQNANPDAALKESIRQLMATGQFAYVEPDFVNHIDLQPTDRAFLNGSLWGLLNNGQQGGVAGADVNVIRAWDITTGDTNLVVAVLDTGINYSHLDLAAQMWRNPDEIPGNGVDDDRNGYIDDVFGINAVADNGDPRDDHGHGSHCAGTIGAAANDGNDHVGVIWKVKLMALKCFNAQGSGFTSDEVQCINYAIQKGVRLSSNSWGGRNRAQALFDAIDAARQQGHLFIAAAGNAATDNDLVPHYPSSFDLDNIISVAALDRSDLLADFSNYGLTSVDVGAPGVDIFSCWVGTDTSYNTISGTSMATPHVSGAAALLFSADPASDYTRVRDRILQRGLPIPALTGKTTTGSRLDILNSMSGRVDGILELSLQPPSGAYFLAGVQTNVIVRVTDDFNVNDAVVVGQFNGATVTFRNNGVAPDANPNDGRYTATVAMPTLAGNYTWSISASAPGKSPAQLSATYEILLAPPNDNFQNASKIPAQGGVREGDNRLATIEPNEPRHGGASNDRSLWWSWSTTVATPVIVDTAGTSFDDDAVLAVYTGETLTQLTEVGSAFAVANGPNGTRAPFLKFTTTPSVTYRIVVAQTATGTNSPGNVVLRVEPNGDLDTTSPTLRVTNYLSGTTIRSRTNTVTLAGTAEDPQPNVSGVASVQIKSERDNLFTTALGTTNWRSQPIQLANGLNRIYIRAFDRADNESQTTMFTLTYVPQELSNDHFGYAAELAGASGVARGTNTSATLEFNEPQHGGNEGGRSLWWLYKPTQSGQLSLSTEGSNFDTLMGLYVVTNSTDFSFSGIQSLAESDDSRDGKFSEISSAVEAGKTYYIAVDGFGGESGVITLQYRFEVDPIFPFTVTVVPAGSGTVFPASQSYLANTAIGLRSTPAPYMQLASYEIKTNGVLFVNTTDPTYTFLLTAPTTVLATFTNRAFKADFEEGGLGELNFLNPGNHWTVGPASVTNGVAVRSSLVARIQPNLPDSTVARLIVKTNLLSGTGSFEFTVNSEPTYDKLEFFVNERLVRAWSGQVPWEIFSFDVPAQASGALTSLEWRYTKDIAFSVENEFVGIDNIDLPDFAPPAPTTNPALQVTMTATEIRITATGPAGRDFRLDSTTEIPATGQPVWTPGVDQNSGPSGTTTFTVTRPSQNRYYRVTVL